jgi:hypothetical protein
MMAAPKRGLMLLDTAGMGGTLADRAKNAVFF